MADGRDTNGLLCVDKLVENPVGADPERAEASQLAAQSMACMGLALK